VDVTKEFELRYKRREADKQAKLEELYEKHDKKAIEFKGVMAVGNDTTKGAEMNDEQKALQKVAEDQAYGRMMEEMKGERDKLVEYFNKDTDLKQKIIITGVK
jgi:hypothetical protein